MKKIPSATFVGLLLAAGTMLWAQEQKAPEGMTRPMPKFGPELAKLSFLAGNFSTENVAYPSPMSKGGSGKGRNMNRWELDSLFLVFNYEGEIAGLGSYKGKGLFSYDGKDSKYKCWWFDSFGSNVFYQGNFIGDTLLLEGEIPLPQGVLKEKIMWHPEGKKFKFRMMQDWGQGFSLSMEETATPSSAAGGKKK